jgi:hypothetical protein
MLPDEKSSYQSLTSFCISGGRTTFAVQVTLSESREIATEGTRRMRFCVGVPALNDDFQPERDGWIKFREPSMLVFWLRALPVAAVTVVGLFVAVGSVADTSAKVVIRTSDVTIWQIVLVGFLTLLGFLAVLVVHELIHLLIHPKHGRTRDSIVGIWPRAFVFYAFYDNEMSRNRFLLMAALPFLLLSLCPVLLFWIVGKVVLWLVFVALVNGIGSCFDLLVIGMVLAQVPRKAFIRNNGWTTYWKPLAGI